MDRMSMSPLRIATLVGAGALVAAWLTAATTTRQVERGGLPPQPQPIRSAEKSSPLALDLAAEVDRLRQRLDEAPVPRENVRSPFKFGMTPPSVPTAQAAVSTPPPAVSASSKLAVTLVGIAENRTAEGPDRIAILSSMGEVVLVRTGDLVGGRLIVDEVLPDAVDLSDPKTSTVYRLRLP